MKKVEEMESVALEDLVILAVLACLENAAELGCPKDKEVDMWFRDLSYKEQYKVAEKMLSLIEKNNKKQLEEIK